MNLRSRTGVTVAVTTVILIISTCASSFEFAGYCRKMCMWGRGGNLCRCSAVHFAGKRAQDQNVDPRWKLWPEAEGTDYGDYRHPDYVDKLLEGPEPTGDESLDTDVTDLQGTEPISRTNMLLLRQQLRRLESIIRRRLKDSA